MPWPQPGSDLAFLVNADAFRQPARDPVAGRIERDRVGHFMPQHRLPVRPSEPPARAGHRDERAETDPEKRLSARQTERADREILLLRQHFHHHRLREGNLVFVRERPLGAHGEFQRTVTEHRHVFGRHAQPHAVLFTNGVAFQLVAQGDEIEGRDIVGIGVVGEARRFPSLLRAGRSGVDWNPVPAGSTRSRGSSSLAWRRNWIASANR